MKKYISMFTVPVLALALLAGCAQEKPASTTEPSTEAASDLAAAREYLFTMYKNAPETTPADYDVVGAVVVGAESYEIEWTADSETVKFVRGDDKMVTVDVDEKNPEEVTYVLTATLKDAAGKTESVSFNHRVPAAVILDDSMTFEQIVEAAYNLEEGLSMPAPVALKGVITEAEEYQEKYGNITVTIAVEGMDDKPIKCFRMSGEGADKLAVGDTICVVGMMKNYKGEIEFDQGCKLVAEDAMKDAKLAMAAYMLEENIAMGEPATMTGVITEAEEFNAKYNNITVTIVAAGMDDKPIKCFRMSGEGADGLAVGDQITVTGTLKNYKGEIEFDAGCTLDAVVKAEK